MKLKRDNSSFGGHRNIKMKEVIQYKYIIYYVYVYHEDNCPEIFWVHIQSQLITIIEIL